MQPTQAPATPTLRGPPEDTLGILQHARRLADELRFEEAVVEYQRYLSSSPGRTQSRAQALLYVVVPLALPGVIATGTFTFILAWNDYIFARVLLSADELKTLPVGIADLYNASVVDWGMIMAAGLLVIAPVAAVFLFIQRFLVAGWGSGGVKG